MEKVVLIEYLNDFLQIKNISDGSQNGLQVDNNKRTISKIGYSVDANSYIFDLAVEKCIDLLIVHHGLFWGVSNTITGIQYERIKKLIDNGIALYGCHLPLDKHNQVGNNIGLVNEFCKVFQLDNAKIQEFGEYHGETIGFGIKFDKTISVDLILEIYTDKVGINKDFYNFGEKTTISSICFVSGGGGNAMQEAYDKGYDLFVTGEAPHYTLMNARELGQSILLGGHRETERIGVDLLANHLKEKFNVEIISLDLKY